MDLEREIGPLFALVAAAALAVVGLKHLMAWRAIRRWPCERVTITGAKIIHEPKLEDEPWLLSFDVKLGTLNGLTDPMYFVSREAAQAAALRFPAGMTLTAWRQPGSTLFYRKLPLETESPWMPLLFAAFFAGYAVLASLGLWPEVVAGVRRLLGPVLPTSPG